MPFAQSDPSMRAAGFVAKAMVHTAPQYRAAFLAALIQHAGQGLKIIPGPEEAAETLFRAADAIVERAEIAA